MHFSVCKPGAAVYVYVQLLADHDYQSQSVRDSPMVGSTVQGRCEESNVLHERAVTAISAPWCLLDHSGEIENVEVARVACSGHDSLLAAHVKGINVCAVSVSGPYAHHLQSIVRRDLKSIFMRELSIVCEVYHDLLRFMITLSALERNRHFLKLQ